MMNIYKVSIILGIFFVIFGLLGMLISGVVNSLVISSLGVMIIVLGVFARKGYRNKTFYLSMFSIVILIGLATIYGFIFNSLTTFDNYLNIGIFLIFLFLFGRAYLLRHKAVKLPWKDEW